MFDMCDNVSDHLPVSICVNIPWNGISALYNYQSDYFCSYCAQSFKHDCISKLSSCCSDEQTYLISSLNISYFVVIVLSSKFGLFSLDGKTYKI